MRSRLLSLISLLVLVFLFGRSSQPAAAHASLLQSLPEANATLDRPPAQIELYFSEPIEPGFSTVEVLDGTGNRVDGDDTQVDPLDPTRMTTTLRSMPDGVYTVSWRALSSVDSHVTAGAFPFAVGDVDTGALEAAAQTGAQFKLVPGEVVARWLTYLASMALVGGLFFVIFVWGPASRQMGLDAALLPPWQRLANIALLTLLVASVLWLLSQAGQVSGRSFVAPWDSSLGRVLFTTRFGALWLARLALALALFWLLPRSQAGRRSWLSLGVGLLLLLTISLGSHAAAQPQPWLPILADWLHLAAASVWVGGLIYFFAGLLSIRDLKPADRTGLTALMIPRFSALALVSVSILVLTGSYASIVHVGSLEALMSTAYGRALLLKLVLIIPMLLLGTINLFVTTPNMKLAADGNGGGEEVSRFRRLVSSEVILGAAVLLTVGLLTTLPPARVSTISPMLGGEQQADDLRVSLEIVPGRPGLNTFFVEVDADRSTLNEIREVLLQFTPASGDLPPIRARLQEIGNGRYSAEGGFLSLPDLWQIQVAVRRVNAFDAFANFEFNVGGPADIEPDAGAQMIPWHRLSGAILLVAGLLFVLAARHLLQRRNKTIVYGLPLGLALTVVGLIVFLNPPGGEGEAVVNPIPPNPDSLAIGQELYQQNCLLCHGVSGAGDGPLGRTLNPAPADLTLHTAPGVHPDSRLYDWITNGFPNSVMPAFQETLTDEERWHVVNYIRTLAQP